MAHSPPSAHSLQQGHRRGDSEYELALLTGHGYGGRHSADAARAAELIELAASLGHQKVPPSPSSIPISHHEGHLCGRLCQLDAWELRICPGRMATRLHRD